MEYATLLRDKMGLRRSYPYPQLLPDDDEQGIKKPLEPKCWNFCCFMVSTGVKIIASLELLLLATFVGGICYQVAFLGNYFSVILLFLVLMVGGFVILLLLGVKYEQPCPLMPYLIWKGSELCLEIISMILIGIFYHSGVFESLILMLSLIAGIVCYFVIGLTFLLTVKQCRRYYLIVQDYYETMERIILNSKNRSGNQLSIQADASMSAAISSKIRKQKNCEEFVELNGLLKSERKRPDRSRRVRRVH